MAKSIRLTVQQLGFVWAILFMLGGILGFVPGITKDQMFLGIFMVNTPHGIMHIVSGALFLLTSLLGANMARLWFRIFGTIYTILAIVGFFVGDGLIFGLISNNQCDAWGHAFLGLILLFIGFAIPVQPAGEQAVV